MLNRGLTPLLAHAVAILPLVLLPVFMNVHVWLLVRNGHQLALPSWRSKPWGTMNDPLSAFHSMGWLCLVYGSSAVMACSLCDTSIGPTMVLFVSAGVGALVGAHGGTKLVRSRMVDDRFLGRVHVRDT